MRHRAGGLPTATRPWQEDHAVDLRRSIRLASLPRSGDAAIETGAVDGAAKQLGAISAIAEVYKSDPTFLAPDDLMGGLRRAAPDLLG